jgi:hypothetical protein
VPWFDVPAGSGSVMFWKARLAITPWNRIATRKDVEILQDANRLILIKP